MAKLVYAAITSLDGYVNDASGNFDWAEPDAEVHAFVNNLERRIGTYLYGRRLYETMVYWETASTGPDVSPVEADYARVWQAADKIVYSRSRPAVSSARTELATELDADAVRALKASSRRNLSIGGPTLAAQALAEGLVDELHLFLNPVMVGGGTRALPDGVRLDLELVGERRFANGVIHLHHRVR
jgi:dihydrofolate reductase